MITRSSRLKACLSALSFSSFVSQTSFAQNALDGITQEGWKSFRTNARSSGFTSCAASARVQVNDDVLIGTYCGCIAEFLATLPEQTIKEHFAAMMSNQPPTGALKTLMDGEAAECMKVAVQFKASLTGSAKAAPK